MRGGGELAEEELALAEPEPEAGRGVAALDQRAPLLRRFGVTTRFKAEQPQDVRRRPKIIASDRHSR